MATPGLSLGVPHLTRISADGERSAKRSRHAAVLDRWFFSSRQGDGSDFDGSSSLWPIFRLCNNIGCVGFANVLVLSFAVLSLQECQDGGQGPARYSRSTCLA